MTRGCGMRWESIRSLRLWLPLLLLPMLVLTSSRSYAGFDHEWALDENGIWARKYQTALQDGVIALEVVGSLWYGNDDQLGHTYWQTLDSSVISGVAAQLLKYGFSRA